MLSARTSNSRYITSDIRKPFEVLVLGITYTSPESLVPSVFAGDPELTALRESICGPNFDTIDVRVGAQLYSNGQALCMPCFSTYFHCSREQAKPTNGRENLTISFPIDVADLPADVQVVFSLYEAPIFLGESLDETIEHTLIGSGCLRYFDDQGIALVGTERLPIEIGVTPDDASLSHLKNWVTESQRLESLGRRLSRLAETNPLDPVDSQLTHVAMQRIQQMLGDNSGSPVVLNVRLPRMDAPLVHESLVKPPPPQATVPPGLLLPPGRKILLFDQDSPYALSTKISISQDQRLYATRYDFINRLGQIQARNQGLDSGIALVNAKPTPSESEQLRQLCRDWAWCLGIVPGKHENVSAPATLKLVWHYRYWLRWQPGGLVPLIWAAVYAATESEAALESVEHEVSLVLGQWSGQVTTAEILTLLLPEFAPPFCPLFVRRYGIELLTGLPHAELSSVLSQVVQACRWDMLARCTGNETEDGSELVTTDPGELTQALIDYATRADVAFVCRLYWLVRTECDVVERALAGTPGVRVDTSLCVEGMARQRGPLRVFIPATLEREFYENVRQLFLSTLALQMPELSRLLMVQVTWMDRLAALLADVSAQDMQRTEKIRYLREAFQQPENSSVAHPVTPIRSPVRPEMVCDRVDIESLHVFKSARQPVRLTLLQVELPRTETEERISLFDTPESTNSLAPAPRSLSISGAVSATPPEHRASVDTGAVESDAPAERSTFIYKMKDDVRQDQLIQQLFSILNSQVNRVLDMRLRPYAAMSLEMDSGLIEIVPNSQTVQEILLRDKTIARYLRDNNDGAALDAAQENYVRSCAGYTVLTYLFGIGDRHLENLMMQPDGHFFHIDFGFILGRDPKVADQTVKLNQNLLENATTRVPELMALAVEIFNQCRKHAPLVLTLFRHMRYSRIRTIEEDAPHDFQFIYSRFLVDHTDTEASQIFAGIIKKALSEIMPQVIDKLHMWVQYFRD